MAFLYRHWGCTAILQIVILVMSLATILLAIICFNYDVEWSVQLAREGRIFTPRERELLQRPGGYIMILELLFIFFETLAMIVGAVNMGLCFFIKSQKYKNRFHPKIMVILAVVYFVSSPLIVTSAIIYDVRMRQVEKEDKRIYTVKFQINDEEIRHFSPSHFYYCHLGNGKPRKATELKGLRIRTTGSKLCQLIGLKIVAAVLSIYMGIICLLSNWQERYHEKYLNSVAAKLAFELHGDSKELTYKQYMRKSTHMSKMNLISEQKDPETTKKSSTTARPALTGKRHDRRVAFAGTKKSPNNQEVV